MCVRERTLSRSFERVCARAAHRAILVAVEVRQLRRVTDRLTCSPQQQARTRQVPPTSHGGLWNFRRKSTCLHAIKFRALCGANVVTSPLKFGVFETYVVHRVVTLTTPPSPGSQGGFDDVWRVLLLIIEFEPIPESPLPAERNISQH